MTIEIFELVFYNKDIKYSFIELKIDNDFLKKNSEWIIVNLKCLFHIELFK